MEKTIIIGAGISALGAGYALRQKGETPILLEKDETYGGLCGNFTIQGFRFDRFVHFSFAKDDEVNAIFSASAPDVYHHIPNAYNIYHGTWIKHPAQNNLFPLNKSEKENIVRDFMARPMNVDSSSITNYEEWLRFQFGNYFAEHFPIPYTRKYWMTEAKKLETKWLGSREGSRLYQPSIEEVIHGCETPDTPVTYYSKEMRYPKFGGFKAFLSTLADNADIRYKHCVKEINTQIKTLTCITPEGDKTMGYNRLISSLPLPVVIEMLGNRVPEDILLAASQLRHTCGYQISIGLKTTDIPPYLWWYIYDEDILPARVYSPSLKSPDNAPYGCSSLQLEIYCEKDDYSENELLKNSVDKLCEIGIIKKEDILFTDVRFEPFANIVFDSNIYEARDIIRSYLKSHNIITIGRFGEWDYLWTDQSLLSGLHIEE